MKTISITHEVHCILTTVHALEGKVGAGYVNRLLRADEQFLIREPHRALPTYGSLENMGYDLLRSTINWLILNRYLMTSGGTYPTIALTPKGQDAMQESPVLEVAYREVTASTSDVQLFGALHDLRLRLSAARGTAPYHLFTDAMLDEMVRRKPQTPEALTAIAGMTPAKTETYGEAILAEICKHVESRKRLWQQQLERRANSPKGQEIKELYHTGLPLDAIAGHQQVKRSTVENYLEALHQTGQINLVTWVGSQLNEQPALNMGVAYFRKWRDARLAEAQQALGLDYHTLRLCRWYALAA